MFALILCHRIKTIVLLFCQLYSLTFLSSSLVPKVEDRCSLAPAVDVLSYSEREWKGNTAKSILIRKVSWMALVWCGFRQGPVASFAARVISCVPSCVSSGLWRDVPEVRQPEKGAGRQLLRPPSHPLPAVVSWHPAACLAATGGPRHGTRLHRRGCCLHLTHFNECVACPYHCILMYIKKCCQVRKITFCLQATVAGKPQNSAATLNIWLFN